MAALDLSSLKAYVSGGAARSLSASTALLDVEHSLIEQRFVEIPFDLAWTAVEVKEKLQQLSGTPVEHQRVHVGGASGPLLDPPHATLASFGVRGGGAGGVRLLFVRDVDPFALGRGGGLHDVSQVTKYVMSDEEYRKRDNTYRAFKERQRALDPSWRSVYEQKQGGGGGGGGARKGAAVQGQPASAASEESEEELRKRIPLQARCQIIPGERRGIVRYVGKVPELRLSSAAAPSPLPVWVGVELDEPLGKHGGVAGGSGGRRYFDCRDKHGTFVRASSVQVGHFPERDPFEEEDDDAGQGAEADVPGVAGSNDGAPLPAAAKAAESADGSEDLYEEV